MQTMSTIGIAKKYGMGSLGGDIATRHIRQVVNGGYACSAYFTNAIMTGLCGNVAAIKSTNSTTIVSSSNENSPPPYLSANTKHEGSFEWQEGQRKTIFFNFPKEVLTEAIPNKAASAYAFSHLVARDLPDAMAVYGLGASSGAYSYTFSAKTTTKPKVAILYAPEFSPASHIGSVDPAVVRTQIEAHLSSGYIDTLSIDVWSSPPSSLDDAHNIIILRNSRSDDISSTINEIIRRKPTLLLHVDSDGKLVNGATSHQLPTIVAGSVAQNIASIANFVGHQIWPANSSLVDSVYFIKMIVYMLTSYQTIKDNKQLSPIGAAVRDYIGGACSTTPMTFEGIFRLFYNGYKWPQSGTMLKDLFDNAINSMFTNAFDKIKSAARTKVYMNFNQSGDSGKKLRIVFGAGEDETPAACDINPKSL
jgi:hypothetical protein